MAKIITDAPVFSTGFTLEKPFIVTNTISQNGFDTPSALNISYNTVQYSCMLNETLRVFS